MEKLVALVCALAVAPLPLSASAQDGEESPTSEPSRREPAEPAPETPDIAILSERSIEQYETRSAQRTQTPDQQRARSGLIASSVVFGVGLGALVGGLAWLQHAECGEELLCTAPIAVGFLGAAIATGGFIGMAVSGARLAKSKSKPRELTEAHSDAARRVRWDLARSRLVF
jgi:hypothetical protein